MNKHHLVRNEGGDRHDFPRELCIVKLAASDTDADISMIEYHLKPNFRAERHHHKKATQVFYILEGEFDFNFDDGPVKLSVGDTLAVPPNTWHAAESKRGGRMICVFRNGRFDEFLKRLSSLPDEQLQDPELMRSICEEFDTYEK